MAFGCGVQIHDNRAGYNHVRMYASAVGVCGYCIADDGLTSKAAASVGDRGIPMPTPAGDTCLNDAATGRPSTGRASRTNCHAFIASSRLM